MTTFSMNTVKNIKNRKTLKFIKDKYNNRNSKNVWNFEKICNQILILLMQEFVIIRRIM